MASLLVFLWILTTTTRSFSYEPVKIPEYDRKSIVHGLRVKHGMSDEDAKECVIELEHYYTDLRYHVVDSLVDHPPRIITNAWEIHIVHTTLYYNFTHSTFGRFIHYKPIDQDNGQLQVFTKLEAFGIRNMNEQFWLREDPERARYRASPAYWNDFYAKSDTLPNFNPQPNRFIKSFIEQYQAPSDNIRILDIGMGQGRNSIWLAQQGYHVTGFDPSVEGIRIVKSRARELKLTTLETHLATAEDFDFGTERWDIILSMYFPLINQSKYLTRLEGSLKHGGLVIMEVFHWDNLESNRSVPLGVTYKTNDIPALLPNLTVIKYEEPMGIADFGNDEVKLIRYIGQKQYLSRQ